MRPLSAYKAQASGATNYQAHTGVTKVTGFAVKAAAAATVTLYDGTDTTGPMIGVIALAAAGGDVVLLPNVHVAVGVFVERSAAAAVTIFISAN